MIESPYFSVWAFISALTEVSLPAEMKEALREAGSASRGLCLASNAPLSGVVSVSRLHSICLAIAWFHL